MYECSKCGVVYFAKRCPACKVRGRRERSVLENFFSVCTILVHVLHIETVLALFVVWLYDLGTVNVDRDPKEVANVY